MKPIIRLALTIFILAGAALMPAVMFAQDEPTGQIPLTGSTGVHDPTLFKNGSTYYVARTNSNRLLSAPSLSGPWSTVPGVIPGGSNKWAPHVVQVGDTYYLYYAVSSFGTNNSRIGVMRSTTPGIPESWVDLGDVIRSGTLDPNGATYNAIDPAVHQDDEGQWWIVWGSHFDGIMIQRLEDDMQTVTGPVTLLAYRGSDRFPVDNPNFNRIEGPVIFKRNNYYYLITAWDWCCRANGNDNTYKVVIGRSEQIDGPYVDKNGIPLTQGGGSIILNSRVALPGVTPAGLYRAPGGADIFIEDGVYYMVYHAYRPANTLAIRPMNWHDDWPYFDELDGGPYDLRDGAYYRLINQDGIITDPNSLQNPMPSNRCLTATLDTEGEALVTNVIQATCADTVAQVWQLHREFDGFYRWRSLIGDQSYCLAVADVSEGTNVLLAPCDAADTTLQQWYFDDTGHGFHRPVVKQANLALEIENVDGVVGTNVVGGYRRDGDHQAGNLTQAAKWPPQQWQFSMVNEPILLGTPGDLTVEATGPDGAPVTYTAPTAVDTQDGTLPVTCTPPSGSVLPLGDTSVTCSATDSDGNTTSASFSVTVVDTTPPSLIVTATPASLWPPNHKLVTVNITIQASDLVDPAPDVTLLSATSSEPDSGTGGGDVPGDIVIIDDQTLQLRAERSGQGSGRDYVITYQATDASGNSTTASATVHVPHDQGQAKGAAVAADTDQFQIYLPAVQR